MTILEAVRDEKDARKFRSGSISWVWPALRATRAAMRRRVVSGFILNTSTSFGRWSRDEMLRGIEVAKVEAGVIGGRTGSEKSRGRDYAVVPALLSRSTKGL